MKLGRFQNSAGEIRVGQLVNGSTVADLSAAGITSITELLEDGDRIQRVEALTGVPTVQLSEVKILTPVEQQEVWAAGVTYLRSKKARMEESDFSANAYDQVYEAPRPEIFFKSLPDKVVHPPNCMAPRKLVNATGTAMNSTMPTVSNLRRKGLSLAVRRLMAIWWNLSN